MKISIVIAIVTSVGFVVQTLRARAYQHLLWPRKSCNVIGGIVYPGYDDPRWKKTTGGTPGFSGYTVWYTLNEITVSWNLNLSIIDLYRISVRDFTAEGFPVKRYFKAIHHAYHQRVALEAIEKDAKDSPFDEALRKLNVLEEAERAAERARK
jgi:hypothetical protein